MKKFLGKYIEMEETWKPIPDHPLYSVSNHGRIMRRNRILRMGYNSKGYHFVNLCEKGIAKSYSVARLVGLTWIPNDENKPTIDHIDRCRTNNHVSNLRWATHAEQQLNRDYPLGAVGHRHICTQYGGYKVQIRRNGKMIVTNWFKKLEDAIVFRDAFIACVLKNEEDAPALPLSPL